MIKGFPFRTSALRSIFAALLWTTAVAPTAAQQGERVYRIGGLELGEPNTPSVPLEQRTGPWVAYREALQQGGFVPGKNLVYDLRTAQGDVSRLAAEAAALVDAKVDVITTIGTPATLAAMQATKTVPIVFHAVGEPDRKGFVASLSRPGGNATGTTVGTGNAKLWQLLRDLAPESRRAGALLYGPSYRASGGSAWSSVQTQRRIAAGAGFDAVPLLIETRDEIEPRLEELARMGHAGLVIYNDSVLFSWRTSILESARRHRLPTVCAQWPDWANEGCALTYAEDWHAVSRGTASQVVKVLRGAKPADLPVLEPTSFTLIINARTVRTLGINLPSSLLGLASEVID
jgi:putative ABC transport system substrate-binding protein